MGQLGTSQRKEGRLTRRILSFDFKLVFPPSPLVILISKHESAVWIPTWSSADIILILGLLLSLFEDRISRAGENRVGFRTCHIPETSRLSQGMRRGEDSLLRREV